MSYGLFQVPGFDQLLRYSDTTSVFVRHYKQPRDSTISINISSLRRDSGTTQKPGEKQDEGQQKNSQRNKWQGIRKH